jgi:hypothetical protein
MNLLRMAVCLGGDKIAIRYATAARQILENGKLGGTPWPVIEPKGDQVDGSAG